MSNPIFQYGADKQVQLALLTATVKLFIRRPTAASGLLPKVLKMATEEADNPDLRDRVCPSCARARSELTE
jgi:vesicle coat complex subunit